MKRRNLLLTTIVMAALLLFLFYANSSFDSYKLRILNLCAIYTILGLSMNLINGFTGLFSLGHAGFMAVGAYTTGLLTMTLASKQQNFFMTPLISPLDKIVLPFFVALLLGGILSAVVGYLIGAPALKLKGDYLAIATLGFGEIIRVIFTNTQSITNGALGLKGIPPATNLYWSFGIAILTIVFMILLIKSSYGRAFKAIREDEIAAESMGINTTVAKISAFIIAAFFAGIAGGLYAHFLMFIDPKSFDWLKSFEIVTFVVAGGMGSLTGSILSASVLTLLPEVLRLFGFSKYRMLLYAILLLVLMLFRPQGLMGSKELSLKVFKIPGYKKAGGEK
jgi:branched-chain amino acid transport system permease protein